MWIYKRSLGSMTLSLSAIHYQIKKVLFICKVSYQYFNAEYYGVVCRWFFQSDIIACKLITVILFVC